MNDPAVIIVLVCVIFSALSALLTIFLYATWNGYKCDQQYERILSDATSNVKQILDEKESKENQK